MRGVCEPPDHYPEACSRYIEEYCFAFPSGFVFLNQHREPERGVPCVYAHEFEPGFFFGQCRAADLDAEYVSKPEVFARALMQHVLQQVSPASVRRMRSCAKI